MEDEKCLDLPNATIDGETVVMPEGASYDPKNECIEIDTKKDTEKKNGKN